MKRILFVDDEPRILEGLQRMLRSQRREWEMRFAVGAGAALAEMEAGPFDAVITDMRMPGMDGAELLAEVQRRHPATVRIILSGHSDPEASTRATHVAHQFLSKPCSAEVLKAAVDRPLSLTSELGSDAVRDLVGGIDRLPAVPELYGKVSRLLSEPDTSTADVADLLEQDTAMAAKLLQMVNSSFIGVGRRVTSVRTAVDLLGVQAIRNLALSTELSRAFDVGSRVCGFSANALHEHSLQVAALARAIARPVAQAHEAYSIGILHDVGKLVLASHLPDQFARIIRTAGERGVALHVIEQEELGVSHATVGASLLALWNLPDSVVQGVAGHHAPSSLPVASFGPGEYVAVANALVNEILPARPDLPVAARPGDGILEHPELTEPLVAWHAQAREHRQLAEDSNA